MSHPVTLTGTVVDPQGTRVSEATVTVYQGAQMVARSNTDARGHFRFQGVPGEYQVVVVGRCFAPLHSSPVPFAAEESTRFTLQEFTEGVAPAACITGPVPAKQRNEGEPPVRREANLAPWDVGALFQGGVGVTENRGSFRFLLGGAHLGKVLTGEIGTGLLRGNFEYAGELFPYWQSFTPRFERNNCSSPIAGELVCSPYYTTGGTYTGVSLTPIILRWNFTHGQRLMPWVQGAGGLLWTNHKYPAFGSPVSSLATNGPGTDTSVWNFTPQFGVGTHLFVKPKRSIDFSANAVHISSASLGDKNPGVNASMQFAVGYSWWTR